jgi:hypothetical protein
VVGPEPYHQQGWNRVGLTTGIGWMNGNDSYTEESLVVAGTEEQPNGLGVPLSPERKMLRMRKTILTIGYR